MINKEEWLSYGIKKQILKPSDINECAIGCYIEYSDIDDVDPYLEKFLDWDDASLWISSGQHFGWIEDIGCIEHELKFFNFVLTLQDVKSFYPEKNKIKNPTSHIPENKDWFAYQCTDLDKIKDIFKKANEILPNKTLIDIGCGKGELLKSSTDSGYTKLIGVEVQEELVNEAKNLVDGEIIHESAESYLLPEEQMHIFLFNPFGNNVLKMFLKNNIDNIKRNNSLVIYNYAFSGHHLMVLFGLIPVFSDGFTVIYKT